MTDGSTERVKRMLGIEDEKPEGWWLRFPFLTQEQDTTCFIVAVANACIFHGRTPMQAELEKAALLAGCATGDALNHKEVVAHLDAPLIPTKDFDKVAHNGGVLNIMHPIFNGHSFFVFPLIRNGQVLVAINSWLGPATMTIHESKIKEFAMRENGTRWNLGKYWRLKRKLT